jgi:signal transduction histidine kinase
MQGISRDALIMPVAIAIVAAGAVIVLWQSLRQDHESRVANVAEATSYATRSELARRLGIQFQSLRALADSWMASSDEAELPADAEVPLELIHFEGVDAIAWSESDGTRFLASGANPVLGYVPSDDEWAPMRDLVAEAYAATAETTLGPFVDGDGHAIFRYYLPVRRGMRRGALVAVIDAHDLLDALLVDEALGYEIRVMCCDGSELYRRGTADDELPGAWTRDGWISPAPGIRWNVTHRPSPQLADDFETSAVDSVLIVGLALALLLGGLVFETRRANERAAAASTAERRVRKLNRELEERVVARTQKLNDVLSDLNTIHLSVSHDLRSALNAISLLGGQLHEADGQNAVAAVRSEKIAANVKRMAGIIDRLLAHSRTSSFDSELEDVDMRALVEQVLQEQAIPPHAVSIGYLPPARADRVSTHILLSNLVGNAFKHGRSSRGLRIEIGSFQTDDRVTAYFVRDYGPGLDKQLADRLFKPMTKPSKSARSDGLGLGLAIAARVVERHDGEIWVESEPGHGATFRFTLRARPAGADRILP